MTTSNRKNENLMPRDVNIPLRDDWHLANYGSLLSEPSTHAKIYWMTSMISMVSSGTSATSVCTAAITSMTDIPSTTSPKTA
jgi:hypothetical protein